MAGILLGYLIQYFSRGEAALPPNIESTTRQSIEQAMARATAESAAEIQASNTPGGAQETRVPATEVQGLAEEHESLRLVEESPPSSPPVIAENDQVTDTTVQEAQTAGGAGSAAANVVAGAGEPQSINDASAGEQLREQTFLINFPFDSDKLIPDSHHVLDSALVMLQGNPDSVASITGFTDNRGDKQYNLTLSVKRANAVQQYLVGAGIARERLSVEGRGVLTDQVIDPVEASDADATDSLQPYRIVQIKISGDQPLKK